MSTQAEVRHDVGARFRMQCALRVLPCRDTCTGRGLPEDALKVFVVILRYASGFSGISTSEKEQCHFPHGRNAPVSNENSRNIVSWKEEGNCFMRKLSKNPAGFFFQPIPNRPKQWWGRGGAQKECKLSVYGH